MHSMHEDDDTVILVPTRTLSTVSNLKEFNLQRGLSSFD